MICFCYKPAKADAPVIGRDHTAQIVTAGNRAGRSITRRRLFGAGAAVAFVMLTTAIGYLFGISGRSRSRRGGNDLEELIRGSAFRNPGRKERLLWRLGEIERIVPLTADDLEGATGGMALSEPEKWEAWPAMPEEKQKKNREL